MKSQLPARDVEFWSQIFSINNTCREIDLKIFIHFTILNISFSPCYNLLPPVNLKSGVPKMRNATLQNDSCLTHKMKGAYLR